LHDYIREIVTHRVRPLSWLPSAPEPAHASSYETSGLEVLVWTVAIAVVCVLAILGLQSLSLGS
jgi:hypothetical protein